MTLQQVYYSLGGFCMAWALLLFWMTGYQHPEARMWIIRVWNQRQHHNTTWWQCARAHAALELGLWDHSTAKGVTMAGVTAGFYSDGDNIGTAIELLILRGIHVRTTMDGTL